MPTNELHTADGPRIKFAVMSLGELTPNPKTGRLLSEHERTAETIEAAVIAEQLGYESFAVGEHHAWSGWSVSAPPVVLAAIAAKTERIRLRTAVTVLPNLDPVRVAEDYATLDLISNGRLELSVGKGNFPHPWEQFGQDPAEQRERLTEAVDLLRLIWSTNGPVSWKGKFRPPLEQVTIIPSPLQAPPPIWWGVSTAPWSVDFAAERGLPIILGGVVKSTEHYGSLVDHYREALATYGYDPTIGQVGTVSQVYIRRDGEQARREFEDHHLAMLEFARVGMRSETIPITDYQERLDGPLVVGSPEEVAKKILAFHERYQHQLHLLTFDVGGLSFADAAETMELFATEVIPIVERELANAPEPAGTGRTPSSAGTAAL